MSTLRFLVAFLAVLVAGTQVNGSAVLFRQSRATCPTVVTKPDFNYIPVR